MTSSMLAGVTGRKPFPQGASPTLPDRTESVKRAEKILKESGVTVRSDSGVIGHLPGGEPGHAGSVPTPWRPLKPSSERRFQEKPMAPEPSQPVTDDSIVVRQLSHYQFSWIAGEPGRPGSYTLQLVLDQGAWEEVLTLDPDDADNLQELLSSAGTVFYDVRRRTLMFGTTPVGRS
ncbi:hypothetical protein [Streptosporangium sp. LJ11]|uniref:hypothetical protein n=1 Tax=Streptosporangium sp. LJ11 TaxID=3436927 RepID=UPI003F78CB7C